VLLGVKYFKISVVCSEGRLGLPIDRVFFFFMLKQFGRLLISITHLDGEFVIKKYRPPLRPPDRLFVLLAPVFFYFEHIGLIEKEC